MFFFQINYLFITFRNICVIFTNLYFVLLIMLCLLFLIRARYFHSMYNMIVFKSVDRKPRFRILRT